MQAVRGAQHFETALALAPSSATTYYDLGRSTELYGGPHGVNDAFAAAQRLAIAQWRAAMGCAPSHPADPGGAGGAGGAVVGAVTWRAVLSEGGAEYGREVPRPHADAEAWRRGGRGLWPHLHFVERAVVAREVHLSLAASSHMKVKQRPKVRYASLCSTLALPKPYP